MYKQVICGSMPTMSDKFRKFLDAFRAGGVEQSTLGTAIEVSANGTTTVPPSEYERLVFKQFADMKRAGQATEVTPAATYSDR
jgi:hypothetical protein